MKSVNYGYAHSLRALPQRDGETGQIVRMKHVWPKPIDDQLELP